MAESTLPKIANAEGGSSQPSTPGKMSASARKAPNFLRDSSSFTSGCPDHQEPVDRPRPLEPITPSASLFLPFKMEKEIRLGIGITTYNRSGSLIRTIDAVRDNTSLPYILFVADDGSSDGTREALRERRVAHVSAPNRGIAWNKNRALYYLHEIKSCDVIILLEDDTFPTELSWERVWVDSALRYGHMNLYPSHWTEPTLKGEGNADAPYVCSSMTGQCVSFSRPAIQAVGYMDTRFRRYGYEHVEHSTRLIKSGYGGVEGAETGTLLPFLIRSSLIVTGLDQPPDVEGIRHNGPIFSHLKLESAFRPAWRGDEEGAFFRFEMSTIYDDCVINNIPVPDWHILATSRRRIIYDQSKDHLLCLEDQHQSCRRIALRPTRNGCYLVLCSDSDNPEQRGKGIVFDAHGNTSVAETPELGTLLTMEYGTNSGFKLKINGGKFLLADMVNDVIITENIRLSEWGTFYFDGYALRKFSQ